MQSGFTEVSKHETQTKDTPFSNSPSSQHGILRSSSRPRSGLSGAGSPQQRARSPSPDDKPELLDVKQLDRKLDRLNIAAAADADSAENYLLATAAGRRISDYENALVMRSSKKQSPSPTSHEVFKVIDNGSPAFARVQLTDFPNEILTQVLSHLHPDSHASVALVSKRFYALVTTPYAWRTAFLRYFPGHDALAVSKKAVMEAEDQSLDKIRSEVRYFTRLTALASWRSEYLLRTRLLRSVVRGKPSSTGSAVKSSQPKKHNAVLTYNSKLPWMVSTMDASLSGGKKGPRVVHGSRDLGLATASNPTTGRIEKMGLDDPVSFQQLDEVFPDLEFWGLDQGLAAVPNVLDVSNQYGSVGGEGFPGGRVYFKGPEDVRGKWLTQDSAIIDMVPEFPKIPELMEAVSCVWIAKTPSIMQATQSMVGIMAGTTLGVVTSYALGAEFDGPRYVAGDITARWVLSPGVPIVDIKVDDNYSLRRKALGRVWAVALNALGEVFYLRETPTPPLAKGKLEHAVKHAWYAGRTAYWELIGSTRRTPQPDEFDGNVVRGSYSPRSPCTSMNLSRQQIVAEAKEIEKFFRYKPAHWRKACQGWDMLRKLEVDFAGGDDAGVGEAIFVVTAGHAKGEHASVRRYLRTQSSSNMFTPAGASTPLSQPVRSEKIAPSIFGRETAQAQEVINGLKDMPVDSKSAEADTDEWQSSDYWFKSYPSTEITASAIDMSTYAVMTAFEDPLHSGSQVTSALNTPTSKHASSEIPGRRARFLAIGTNTGSIFVWNTRVGVTPEVKPLRVIQTDSPEVTSLGVSALYLVHGGSDSLVQAWDPLASTLEPIRTLNAKSNGRIPRHILHANPALQHANFFSVGAIFLDPNPTALRGVVAFGTFLRFWTYSSTNQSPGRKRRNRHSDVQGRLASRRLGTGMQGYIDSVRADIEHEEKQQSKELDRLRKRFGVGLAELTEEEALQYAQMVSEESALLAEQRRFIQSDTGSTADNGDTTSSTGSADTITPEPSLNGNGAIGSSASLLPPVQEEADDDFEEQIQRAIRLSLLESSNDTAESPRDRSSEELEFRVTVKNKSPKKNKGKAQPAYTSASASSSAAHTPLYDVSSMSYANTSNSAFGNTGVDEDDDLAIALRLSMEEEEARQKKLQQEESDAAMARAMYGGADEEFPPLEVKGKGKGRAF
ncbi:putative F-box/WD repeat-containing protein POF10 [Podospora australis]|uniref:F-box/WD repeat-containing protein POF10 n=1 Tax=Podospora australis TaxID=1536484 RepID=A0AAN6WT65_9PEZI|nr:putative F-box/WD repeat-containing protein POF10 [Podospora australis]